MFYKYICKSSDKQWVIFLINPSVLWELDCKFYCENAASSDAKISENNSDRRSPNSLRQMFDNYTGISRSDLGIANNFTTNPQAEVLVFDNISPSYIDKVIFKDLNNVDEQVKLMLKQYQKEFEDSKYYFSPRNDWRSWSMC